MTALTTQAVTAVPVPVDMKWILMESLALVRNMTKQSIIILANEKYIFVLAVFSVTSISYEQDCPVRVVIPALLVVQVHVV